MVRLNLNISALFASYLNLCYLVVYMIFSLSGQFLSYLQVQMTHNRSTRNQYQVQISQ